MKRKIILLTFYFPLSLLAQIGGTPAFSFVNMELSPRIEAMGGSGFAIIDYNPSDYTDLKGSLIEFISPKK